VIEQTSGPHEVGLSDPHSAVLGESTRNGIVECRFRGSVVALDAHGTVLFERGTPAVAVYVRSANKPMQAAAMVGLGLDLPSELLAMVCASHSGEARHVALARHILALGGLTEADLQNTAYPPLGPAAQADLYRSGGEPSRLTADCSGKHAGMLVTAKLNGWPLTNYLHAEHPLQKCITQAIKSYGQEEPSFIGVDGCGAPAHGLSLVALAKCYARLSLDDDGIAHAMRRHPENVGGTGRDVTRLMQALPGFIAKDGADGVLVVSAPDGRTVALKMADGSLPVRVPVALAVLELIGFDLSAAAPLRTVTIYGGGQPVGEIRAHSQLLQ
jgi:L-asparaginase II